jgi:UDP-N-acetylmuramate dehydrogenase
VSGPDNEWFVAACLRFNAAHDHSTVRQSKEFLEHRNATQPTGAASCGSVFKNPPGDFAGRLIECAGLKGLRHGGCAVSHKHANFIINDDHATASELEELIAIIRERVAKKFNITLEPEVRIIGAPPAGNAKVINHA